MKVSLKSLIQSISSLRQFVIVDIWRLDFRRLSPIKARFLRYVEIILIVVKRSIQNRLLVRSAALVYATLMSIVPLLAVVFSLLKGFGYHNALEPFLTRLLAPLGEQAVQRIIPPIVKFVGNANLTTLGAIGFLVFLLSSISIIKKMELSFNDVWCVRKKRGLHRRIGDYLSILIIGSVLVITAIAVTASLQNYVLLKTIREIPVIKILANITASMMATWVVFFFVLVFVPNTKVKIKSALYGAMIAGTLWQAMNFFFARVIVISYQSGAKAALYASFAVFPMLLVWIYFSWTIVMLGTGFTYVHQNLKRITWEEKVKSISPRFEESIALKIMLIVSQKFYKNEKAPTHSDLSESLQIPLDAVDRIIIRLLRLGLVNVIGRGEARYAPVKSLEALRLREILEKLRTYGGSELLGDKDDPINQLVGEIQNKYDKTLKKAFADISIRDLLDRIDKG
ncbi:MAG: YihY/virulence factor BrkB family protein [Candidatus Aminicenantes bacterium]|nr:MAG: YihY/virulence factor BrkB family protein [Candidatus Aminicenantes bacterium]